MDILAIRGKTVSAVICQLLWRELRKKIKNWMLRSIFNFCFWTKNWSIDHALSDKTLECCFSLNMDSVNVDFVRDLVVTQGKTHSQVSLLLQEAYPGKRGLSSRSVRRFCLKNGIHAQNRRSNEELEDYTKEVVARVGIFAWIFFFSCKVKNGWIKKFFMK